MPVIWQTRIELKSDATDKIDGDRRALLTGGLVGGAVAAAALMSSAAHAQAPAAPALSDKPWWPHPKWGKDDVAGASNWMTPAKVLDAVKWIKDGKVHRIGRIYEIGDAEVRRACLHHAHPGRRRPAARSAPTSSSTTTNSLPPKSARPARSSMASAISASRWARTATRTRCATTTASPSRRSAGPTASPKIGIENVKPFFTRGHLFDVEAHKGKMMEAGEEITVADLRACLQKQSMNEADIKEGDAVFFNTGWGKLWMKNNDKFNSGEPGIGLEVAKWVVDKGVCLTGADQWATEVVPNPNKDLAFVVHSELICKQGIYNHENLDFTTLIADKKYQFVYIFSPAPIKGATGSNGGPIAVT